MDVRDQIAATMHLNQMNPLAVLGLAAGHTGEKAMQVRDPSVPGSYHCENRSVFVGWRLLIHTPAPCWILWKLIEIDETGNVQMNVESDEIENKMEQQQVTWEKQSE